MPRIISLERAKSQFPHRFTMEHVPAWALKPKTADTLPALSEGEYYPAPMYRTDQEWYENTVFPGEALPGGEKQESDWCYTRNASWPLGLFLTEPFRIES